MSNSFTIKWQFTTYSLSGQASSVQNSITSIFKTNISGQGETIVNQMTFPITTPVEIVTISNLPYNAASGTYLIIQFSGPQPGLKLFPGNGGGENIQIASLFERAYSSPKQPISQTYNLSTAQTSFDYLVSVTYTPAQYYWWLGYQIVSKEWSNHYQDIIVSFNSNYITPALQQVIQPTSDLSNSQVYYFPTVFSDTNSTFSMDFINYSVHAIDSSLPPIRDITSDIQTLMVNAQAQPDQPLNSLVYVFVGSNNTYFSELGIIFRAYYTTNTNPQPLQPTLPTASMYYWLGMNVISYNWSEEFQYDARIQIDTTQEGTQSLIQIVQSTTPVPTTKRYFANVFKTPAKGDFVLNFTNYSTELIDLTLPDSSNLQSSYQPIITQALNDPEVEYSNELVMSKEDNSTNTLTSLFDIKIYALYTSKYPPTPITENPLPIPNHANDENLEYVLRRKIEDELERIDFTKLDAPYISVVGEPQITILNAALPNEQEILAESYMEAEIEGQSYFRGEFNILEEAKQEMAEGRYIQPEVIVEEPMVIEEPVVVEEPVVDQRQYFEIDGDRQPLAVLDAFFNAERMYEEDLIAHNIQVRNHIANQRQALENIMRGIYYYTPFTVVGAASTYKSQKQQDKILTADDPTKQPAYSFGSGAVNHTVLGDIQKQMAQTIQNSPDIQDVDFKNIQEILNGLNPYPHLDYNYQTLIDSLQRKNAQEGLPVYSFEEKLDDILRGEDDVLTRFIYRGMSREEALEEILRSNPMLITQLQMLNKASGDILTQKQLKNRIRQQVRNYVNMTPEQRFEQQKLVQIASPYMFYKHHEYDAEHDDYNEVYKKILEKEVFTKLPKESSQKLAQQMLEYAKESSANALSIKFEKPQRWFETFSKYLPSTLNAMFQNYVTTLMASLTFGAAWEVYHRINVRQNQPRAEPPNEGILVRNGQQVPSWWNNQIALAQRIYRVGNAFNAGNAVLQWFPRVMQYNQQLVNRMMNNLPVIPDSIFGNPNDPRNYLGGPGNADPQLLQRLGLNQRQQQALQRVFDQLPDMDMPRVRGMDYELYQPPSPPLPPALPPAEQQIALVQPQVFDDNQALAIANNLPLQAVQDVRDQVEELMNDVMDVINERRMQQIEGPHLFYDSFNIPYIDSLERIYNQLRQIPVPQIPQFIQLLGASLAPLNFLRDFLRGAPIHYVNHIREQFTHILQQTFQNFQMGRFVNLQQFMNIQGRSILKALGGLALVAASFEAVKHKDKLIQLIIEGSNQVGKAISQGWHMFDQPPHQRQNTITHRRLLRARKFRKYMEELINREQQQRQIQMQRNIIYKQGNKRRAKRYIEQLQIPQVYELMLDDLQPPIKRRKLNMFV